MSKGLLIFICIVLVIGFSVAYAELHKKWEYERTNRITYENLYRDCLSQSGNDVFTEWWR